MGVDCSAVAGFGIELTGAIVEKMIAAGMFTEEAWEDDEDACLDESGFSHGEAGSHYSGDITRYLFVSGDTIQKLAANENKFIEALAKIGVEIKSEDIVEVCDVLWW